jgi:hypothetical protein
VPSEKNQGFLGIEPFHLSHRYEATDEEQSLNEVKAAFAGRS